MELLDSMEELHEIVKFAAPKRLNDYSQQQLTEAAARNKLHLLKSLMKSEGLSEEEAIQALGFAPRGIERYKQIVANSGINKRKVDLIYRMRMSNNDLAVTFGFLKNIGDEESLQEIVDEIDNQDPNKHSSILKTLKKYTKKKITEVTRTQNAYAVGYLHQSMNLSIDQAKVALGITPKTMSQRLYQSGEKVGRLIGKLKRK